MATISELNVRLGLLYKDFDKSLSAVEKRLERSGRKFSQLGNDLTIAVTAPLAALGVSAIQQAGEIEALKLAMTSTFESAGRSAEDATAEVEALRQAAKAPGLDFERAVKGSIRLQGVGIAAEEARNILVQMANAIALTGGTADDLDGVTRQFSQMIAKGRVLQEDVSIIAERMPRISNLMQQAFGTASVEAIRASGVSAKEFVDRITEAATALPRVEGGIKNALVNAGAEARNSLASLGEAINKAFDIPKTLDSLTKGLAEAVEWFKNLDEGTQRTIVQVGAFAIALGPAVKVLGAVQGAAAQAVSVFGSVVGGLKNVTGAILTTTSSAAGLRVALIAATGGIAAIILGIAAAVTILSDDFDAASYATEQFAKAQKSVNEEASKEVGQLNKNIDALKDVRTSTEDRKKAADSLLAAYPGYLKGVDLEKASLERLNEIQKELTSNIIRGIAERKKADAVNAIYEKQAAILLRIQEIQRTGQTTVGENTLIDTGDLIRNGSRSAAIIEQLQSQVADLGKQANVTAADFDKAFGLQTRAIDPLLEKEYRAREAADEARDSFLGLNKAVEKSTASASGASGAAANSAEQMAKAYKSAIKSIEAVGKKGEILDSEILGEKAKEVESQMERLIEAGFGPSSKPIQNLKKYLIDIRAEIATGFVAANTTQTAVAEIEKVSTALGTLKTAQENAGSRAAVIEQLTEAYPEYLRGIDLEKASLEELDRIQQNLTKTILESAESRGPNVSAQIDVSAALSELQKLANVPAITATVDVSGALAELEKLTQGPEIAATVDVSAALNELKKIADIPDLEAKADIDVSAILAEISKISNAIQIPANIDVSGAVDELRKVSAIPEITATVDVSGALAELEKLNLSPEIAATADVSGALTELRKLADIPDISAIANVDISAALAELEKLTDIPPLTAKVDTAGAIADITELSKALDVLRSKDSGAGLRAGAIAKLTDSYPEYLRNIDLEKAGIERLNQVQRDLTKTIISAAGAKVGAIIPQADTTAAVEQIERLRASLDALRNTTTGDEGRAAAIRDLTAAYPDYLRGIDLEKAGVAELNELQNTLTQTIVEAAAKRSQVTAPIIDTAEAQKQVAALAASLDTLRNTSGGDDARAAAIKEITDAYPEYLKNIDLEKADIAQLIELQNTLTAAIQQTASTRASSGGGAVGVAPSIATLPTATSVQSIELTGAEEAINQANAFAESLNLAQSAHASLAESLSSGSGLEQMQAVFAELRNGAISFGDAITQSAAVFNQQYGQIASDTLGQVSEIASGIIEIQAAKAEQEKALLDKEYADRLAAAQGNAAATKKIEEELAAKKAAIDKKVAKSQQTVAIVQAVINTALGVTSALGSAPPPYNFILAALTAAAGAVQIATIKSQAFAEGGVVTKPTLGLVGEYAGAAQNPEIISPERKMRQVFRDEIFGNGTMPTELYSVIRGEDLLLVTDKAARRRGRTV